MLPAFKLILIIILSPLFLFTQELAVYPLPSKSFDHGSAIYTITVTQGLVKHNSFVYVSHAGTDPTQKEWGGQQGKSFHYSIFSFSGEVSIEVSKFNSSARYATIRPSSITTGTISTRVKDGNSSITFNLTKHAKISVEFDDDPLNKEALMIFADSLEKKQDIPDITSALVYKVTPGDRKIHVPIDKKIIYFEAGVFEPGYVELPAQVTQVYIAGGAFVRAHFVAELKNNNALQINGRGILSNDKWPFHYPVNTDSESETDFHTWYRMIKITGGSHHRIEGITFVDASAGIITVYSSHDIILENINVNAFRYNSDAANLHGNNNIIDNCFFRSNEDVIIGNGNNTTIKNCIFWQLHNGSIIQLGWTPRNIGGNNLIENCTILHAEWDNDQNPNIGFINLMCITAPKTVAVTENFTIRNINTETEILRFADFRMLRNGKGQPAILRTFSFENIHLKRKNPGVPLFYFGGYDAGRMVSNIVLDKVYVNDRLVDQLSGKRESLIKTEAFSEEPVYKINR